MKRLILPIIISVAACMSSPGDVIKQWNFNSNPIDFINTTGTRRPADGIGTPAQAIGGVGNRFGVVSTATQPYDPETADNTHWRIGTISNDGFPAQGTANKTAGVEFRVNTSGYNNIQFHWNQENSATASRYWRVQYTINGTDWLDTPTVVQGLSIDANGEESGTPIWQHGLSVDFSGITGANNNPDFGIRIVSEFESTATGSGVEGYVANRATANYGTGGTLWLDMVEVTGNSINPANNWPTISAIPDENVLVGESTPVLAFFISDVETLAQNLVVTARASDTNLIGNVTLGGSGGSRTIRVTPAAGQQGMAVISVFVQDAGGKVSEAGFEVVVVEPEIFSIPNLVTTGGQPITTPVVTTNLPGHPSTWVMTAGSSDPTIVNASGIVFGSSAASNYVTITPLANAMGSTTITITNTGDRGWQAIQSFQVLVLPEPVVFFDMSAVPLAAQESLAPTDVVEGLSVAPLTRGPGIVAANLTYGFSANNWNNTNSTTNPVLPSRENAIAEGEYYQFAVTVLEGYRLSIASLDHALRRSAINGPMNFEWQYSFNGFTTPGITMTNFIYLGRDSGTAPAVLEPFQWMTRDTPGQGAGNTTWPFLLERITALQNVPGGTTITFRLYAWGTGAGADSNTTALGRNVGPRLRGTVATGPSAPPNLTVRRVGSSVVVSWPISATGFTLQSTTSLPGNWQASGLTPTVSGDENVVTINNPTGSLFLRLVQ
jgi:hypothetical protein